MENKEDNNRGYCNAARAEISRRLNECRAYTLDEMSKMCEENLRSIETIMEELKLPYRSNEEALESNYRTGQNPSIGQSR